jgi:hypothetical protein
MSLPGVHDRARPSPIAAPPRWLVSRRFDLAWFFGGAALSAIFLALYFVVGAPIVALWWVWLLAFDGPADALDLLRAIDGAVTTDASPPDMNAGGVSRNIAFYNDGRPTQVKDIANGDNRLAGDSRAQTLFGFVVGARPPTRPNIARRAQEIRLGDVVRALEDRSRSAIARPRPAARPVSADGRRVTEAIFRDLSSRVEACFGACQHRRHLRSRRARAAARRLRRVYVI